jgi:hypothetical protein
VILGKKLKQFFVSVDVVLDVLVKEHEAFMSRRQQKARKLFAKYDENGDGVFSRDEFGVMLRSIFTEATDEVVDELWRVVGGDDGAGSSLNPDALEAKLFTISRLHKTATLSIPKKSKSNAVAVAASEVAREELDVLVSLWDSVRNAEDGSSAEMDDLVSSWSAVMRMKAWLRHRLHVWRQRAMTNLASRKGTPTPMPGQRNN